MRDDTVRMGATHPRLIARLLAARKWGVDAAALRGQNPFMTRTLLTAAGILGALGVALGAFGAHGLEAALADAPDLARRLAWWRTAVLYHLLHTLALVIPAWVRTRGGGRATSVAGLAFLVGIALFSGTLYAMTLGAPRALGAVTPLGGLSLIVGWLAVATSARTFASKGR